MFSIFTYIYTIYVKLLILFYACTCCPLYFLCNMKDICIFFVDCVSILFWVIYTVVKDFGC